MTFDEAKRIIHECQFPRGWTFDVQPPLWNENTVVARLYLTDGKHAHTMKIYANWAEILVRGAAVDAIKAVVARREHRAP
jgi:hypothetical protein